MAIVKCVHAEHMDDYVDIAEHGVDGTPMNLLLIERDQVGPDGEPNPAFVLWGNYKTSSSYGVQMVELPMELSNVLRTWVFEAHSRPPKFLLYQTRDETKPLGKDGVLTLLRQALQSTGKKVTMDGLRHAYVSWLSENPGWAQDPEARAETAKAMAHSVETQSMYVKQS